MGAVQRGIRNVWRRPARALAFVGLYALALALLALMAQAAIEAREQVAGLDARVRTLIELRQAGAFGTGGFGGDRPVGEEAFTVHTLDKARRIPSAGHIARTEAYVYKPLIDPSKKNAYAMAIGLAPGTALRAIGEIGVESARVIAGRAFAPEDVAERVAVVGKLYAEQRLGLREPFEPALAGARVELGDQPFRLIGLYTTGNDFGDNHLFVPIEAFRAVFEPGDKLSKIFVTVDSVANVEQVVAELKAIEEADVVTTPEAVATARSAVGGLAAATAYAAVGLALVGAVLIVATMVLAVRERVPEVGTLKAIGAGNTELAAQFLTEAACLSALGGLGAIALAAPLAAGLRRFFGLAIGVDARVLLLTATACVAFALLGSVYPVVRAARLSPVEALRTE